MVFGLFVAVNAKCPFFHLLHYTLNFIVFASFSPRTECWLNSSL